MMTDRQVEQVYDTTWEQDIASAKSEMTKSAFHAVAAGMKFRDAKEKHRQVYGGTGWEQACKERGLTTRTVDALIQVAHTFGENSEINFSIFSATVLKLLAAPSVPEPVRGKIVEQAQTQGGMTAAEVQKRINEAKAEGMKQQLEKDIKDYKDAASKLKLTVRDEKNKARIDARHEVHDQLVAKDREIGLLQSFTPQQEVLKAAQQELQSTQQTLRTEKDELATLLKQKHSVELAVQYAQKNEVVEGATAGMYKSAQAFLVMLQEISAEDMTHEQRQYVENVKDILDKIQHLFSTKNLRREPIDLLLDGIEPDRTYS